MAVLVTPDLGAAGEAFWAEVEILAGGAGHPETIEFLSAGVTLIPSNIANININTMNYQSSLLCENFRYSWLL